VRMYSYLKMKLLN